jgi:hypothetical protein
MVIGPNHEAQLAPYHEFECTGLDDQYIQDVDETAEVQKRIDEEGLAKGLEYYGLEDRTVTDMSEVDTSEKHKFRYAVVKDGKLIKAGKRTNPNAKWDWYETGGRWTGFFRLKAGAIGTLGTPGLFTEVCPGTNKADVVRKGDVDWDGMRDATGRRAGEYYDKVRNAIAEVLGSADFSAHKTWEEVLGDPDKLGAGDADKARTTYGEQPTVAASRKLKDPELGWIRDLDGILRDTREQYVQAARNAAGVSFAIVKDGQWYQRGDMGWWGSVSNAKDNDRWYTECAALLDGLPDDTILTIVDCHI